MVYDLTLWDVNIDDCSGVSRRARTEVVVIIAQKYAFVGVRPKLPHQVPRRLLLPARRWVHVSLTCSAPRLSRLHAVYDLLHFILRPICSYILYSALA